MKTDDLLDALGEADPAYIQEAEDVRYLGARRKHFMQMAACVALLLIGGPTEYGSSMKMPRIWMWQRRRVQKRQTLMRQRHPTAT